MQVGLLFARIEGYSSAELFRHMSADDAPQSWLLQTAVNKAKLAAFLVVRADFNVKVGSDWADVVGALEIRKLKAGRKSEAVQQFDTYKLSDLESVMLLPDLLHTC